MEDVIFAERFMNSLIDWQITREKRQFPRAGPLIKNIQREDWIQKSVCQNCTMCLLSNFNQHSPSTMQGNPSILSYSKRTGEIKISIAIKGHRILPHSFSRLHLLSSQTRNLVWLLQTTMLIAPVQSRDSGLAGLPRVPPWLSNLLIYVDHTWQICGQLDNRRYIIFISQKIYGHSVLRR